jgi:hypothetical protein
MNICFLLVLLSIAERIKSQCNLNIADNKISSFRGGDIIFSKGQINQSWSDSNTMIRHETDNLHDIEYFYATEIFEAAEPKEHLVLVL